MKNLKQFPFVAFLLLLGAQNSQALSFQPIAEDLNLNQPLFMVVDPEPAKSNALKSFWVIEKEGKVQRVSLTSSGALTRELLDISTVPGFTSDGEQGLLGLAVDPNFKTNKFVYFYQSQELPNVGSVFESGLSSLIVRYSWDGAQQSFLPSSRRVVFSFDQEPYSNHKGGMIAFGPDNMLYIGTGDGGSGGDPQNHGQNKSTHLGKILRIALRNGQMSVPADNPFFSDSNAKPEIWALGLRNPWRFSFDRQTGDLWAGDVGQGSFEEVDLITRGGNFGWKLYEGNSEYDNPTHRRPPGYQGPVYAYGRQQGSTVIGGYVYRGKVFAKMVGSYIFGDYGSSKIWTLRRNNSSSTPLVTQIATVFGLVSFAEDTSGEIYAVSIQGQIFQLR